MTTQKRATSMRLSPTAEGLLEALAKKLGVSKSAVFELAIRAFAEQQNVRVADEGTNDD